jgi:hypothetical protein
MAQTASLSFPKSTGAGAFAIVLDLELSNRPSVLCVRSEDGAGERRDVFDDRRDSTDWAPTSSTSACLPRGDTTGGVAAREWSVAESLPQPPEACQPCTVITELPYGAALR